MVRDRRFAQLDVFTAVSTLGNPLAVVIDGEDLSDEAMATFARWTNLSETAFLLPPSDPAADYRVRIFTPGNELSFAGHPTLGSCRAWLDAGGRPRRPGVVVQECGVGLVAVRADEERLAFEAPALSTAPVADALLGLVLAALGLGRDRALATSWLVNGPHWLGILVDDAEAVLALEPDHAALRSLAEVGIYGPYPPGGETQFEARAFADPDGVPRTR
jgi:PhzF family phenazine biosynthesis protein